MIATEHFVFIHMHKTGGQTLNRLLLGVYPGAEKVGYHYPLKMLPQRHAHKPRLGFVRNPWDWYVSWYAFNSQPHRNNSLFRVLSDAWQLDFAATIRNLACLGGDTEIAAEYRLALQSVLPESLDGNTGVGLSKSCIDELAASGKGYLSWQCERMLGDANDPLLNVGRFDRLREDFVTTVKRLQVPEAAQLADGFDSGERLNASTHEHYSRYYDAALSDLVAVREAPLIERFGFEFDALPGRDRAARFPRSPLRSADPGFRKLRGEARNFLCVATDVDVAPVAAELARTPSALWDTGGRAERFDVHRRTASLPLVYDEVFRHANGTRQPAYGRFEALLQPLLQRIAAAYPGDGEFVRAVFARLPAGERIDPHSDEHYSLLSCHRVHVPIVTNPGVRFFVGGEYRHLPAGEAWEINNAKVHAVDNAGGDDRVHLILDWVPASTLRPEDRHPAEPDPGRNARCPCGSGKRFKHCHGATA